MFWRRVALPALVSCQKLYPSLTWKDATIFFKKNKSQPKTDQNTCVWVFKKVGVPKNSIRVLAFGSTTGSSFKASIRRRQQKSRQTPPGSTVQLVGDMPSCTARPCTDGLPLASDRASNNCSSITFKDGWIFSGFFRVVGILPPPGWWGPVFLGGEKIMKMLEIVFFWWGEMWMEVEVDHLFFVFFCWDLFAGMIFWTENDNDDRSTVLTTSLCCFWCQNRFCLGVKTTRCGSCFQSWNLKASWFPSSASPGNQGGPRSSGAPCLVLGSEKKITISPQKRHRTSWPRVDRVGFSHCHVRFSKVFMNFWTLYQISSRCSTRLTVWSWYFALVVPLYSHFLGGQQGCEFGSIFQERCVEQCIEGYVGTTPNFVCESDAW